MASELDYAWRLRLLLAERGIFNSKPLVALLAEHGIRLSDSQVWRMVTGKPERLNLQVLVALCSILDCTPNDLIQPVERPVGARLERRSAAQAVVMVVAALAPTNAWEVPILRAVDTVAGIAVGLAAVWLLHAISTPRSVGASTT